MLTWTRTTRGLEAVGRRGWYTIRRHRHMHACLLTAVGHDELPMLILPADGRHFATVADAKDYANQIERVRAVEPEVSGA